MRRRRRIGVDDSSDALVSVWVAIHRGLTARALASAEELDLTGDDLVAGAPPAGGLPLVELQATRDRDLAALLEVFADALGEPAEAHDLDVDGAAVLAFA